MISYVLQTQQLTATHDDLMDEISRVADTRTVSCLANTSRPTSIGEEALDDRECTIPVQHIQSLLLLSKTVEVLTDYQIGKYLSFLANDGSHAAANKIIAHLCSRGASAECRSTN